MANEIARTNSGYRLRRIAMQRELVTRQERVDVAESELRLLERRARKLEREIEACVTALVQHRTTFSGELSFEYQQLLGTARQDFDDLHERRERLGQELDSHQTTISKCLEVSKKNRDLQFATEQASSQLAILEKDAEVIALRNSGVIGND